MRTKMMYGRVGSRKRLDTSRSDLEEMRAGQRVTWIGMACNVFLIACKFAAGILGNSKAMVADAVHSVSDFLTDAVVLVGLRMGRRAPDASHHFGHGRIETLASLLVGGMLILVAGLLAYEAFFHIRRGTPMHPNWLAFAGALLSILVKEVLYRYTARVGRRIGSSAVEANAWHHRSDALSSVAVLVGVGGALVNPAWGILDAYATLVVSLFILKVGGSICWNSIREMVDTAPSPEILDRMTQCSLNVRGVQRVHDLKVRSTGGRYQLQIHVVVDGSMSVVEGHRIAKEVERCLLDEVERVAEVTVHVDPLEHRTPD